MKGINAYYYQTRFPVRCANAFWLSFGCSCSEKHIWYMIIQYRARRFALLYNVFFNLSIDIVFSFFYMLVRYGNHHIVKNFLAENATNATNMLNFKFEDKKLVHANISNVSLICTVDKYVWQIFLLHKTYVAFSHVLVCILKSLMYFAPCRNTSFVII